MNEPSVFNTVEGTMPKDCLQHDGKTLVLHKEVHNIYGHKYQEVAYESLLDRHANKTRPFVLTRSFYTGGQRYGFVWTGDNAASWEHMKSSLDTVQGISLCGFSACGADVGGFFGNPTEELLRSWFELGVFYMFFRGHSETSTIRREPWLFSNETLTSIRNSIKLRYNLLLYWYTKFYEHTLTGLPVLKPMWLAFPHLYQEYSDIVNHNQFVVGNEFIIHPQYDTKE